MSSGRPEPRTAAARNLGDDYEVVRRSGHYLAVVAAPVPWVSGIGGTYRSTGGLSYVVVMVADVHQVGDNVAVVPGELRELPLAAHLRGDDADSTLVPWRSGSRSASYSAGEVIVELRPPGRRAVTWSRTERSANGVGKYGEATTLGYWLAATISAIRRSWLARDLEFTGQASTRCTVLSLSEQSLAELVERSEAVARPRRGAAVQRRAGEERPWRGGDRRGIRPLR